VVNVRIDPVSDVGSASGPSAPGYLAFDVSVTRTDGTAVVEVSGDLDCYSSPQLRAAFVELADEGVRRVVLDVGGTQFVDSTGLGVLVGAKRRFHSLGGDLLLRSLSPATARLLEVTGLAGVFETV
jgi:anti-sigma B factor antagonist